MDGATIDEIKAISSFDTDLKNILMKYTLQVERVLKAVLSYSFAEKTAGTSMSYLNIKFYDQSRMSKALNVISDLTRILSRNCNKPNSSINHYIYNHDEVPIWVLSEYMTFGNAIDMYENVESSIADAITIRFNDMANKHFEFIEQPKIKVKPKSMRNILSNIKTVRNLVAHNNYIYGFQCINDYPNLIPHKSNVTTPNIYITMCYMKLFLEDDEFDEMINTLKSIITTLSSKLNSIHITQITSKLGYLPEWVNSIKSE